MEDDAGDPYKANEALESNPELNMLMKVQTAQKDWDDAPKELVELQNLLLKIGYHAPWTPKKLGINLLTANKIRAIVLKRVLMKLYPFDAFWATDTLDETLNKCLLVCQQLGLEAGRAAVWGQCSMDASYEFWKRLLNSVPRISNSREESDTIQEAKSNVISSLMASRGTDWDKMIAKNFEESIGKTRNCMLIKRCGSAVHNSHKPKHRPGVKPPHYDENHNWRSSFHHQHHHHANNGHYQDSHEETRYTQESAPTTTSFAIELKQESQEMIASLKNVEKYYRNDCILQINEAFEFGYKVCELAEEFEGYMTTNNRGAFKDVESLANHTDRVIKAMSKLSMAFTEFAQEFRKYFETGRGDEPK